MNFYFFRNRSLSVLLQGLMCVSIVYVGYRLDIAPLQKKLSLKQSQAQNIKQDIHVLLYRQLMLEERIHNLPETKKRLDEWQRKFIKKKDMRKLLNEILVIGKTEKLRFNFFDSGHAVKENDYVKLPVHASVVGTYAQTANFITQVAHLPWIVVMGDFTLIKLVPNKAGALFETDLAFNIFY